MKSVPATRAASILRPIGQTFCTLLALTLSGCAAAPPLRLYTLSEDSASSAVSTDAPSRQGAPVIEVTRVSLPDYMDSSDLLVRHGDVLERSSTGRWASRLSLGATELLTARLAMRWPDAWVTDEPQTRTPDYRLVVHISRLDITSTGTGVMEADWVLVPNGTSGEITRHRIQFIAHGSVSSDESVARFERALFDRLASAIDVPGVS